MHLPIDAILPELVAALRAQGRAVLQAPPGAGKTTRVPLALLPEVTGKILMLEPRRLATRAAAERMAQTLGEDVGATVGYRVRGDSAVGPDTRIEVVTEGILTRMLQDNPELPGVGAVIFDEFHERSLNADLGLALTWEVRGALRDDLWLVVMSATLDAGPVAALLDDAPLVSSEGRAFPVETRWLSKPPHRDTRFEASVADLVVLAMEEVAGGCLVFLPGEGEIRRVEGALQGRLPKDVVIRPLFGAMKLADQRAAIRPEGAGRKLVLATSIAETSLTIEDVRVVVDAGRARRARFDPDSGMARLVTEPVSRAEADQRRGRAGRVAAGVCYRMWTKGAEGALPAFPPAEIEAADLTSLALELALWGNADGLAFLTPPPEGALGEARALLQALGALDGRTITPHGRKLARLPLHPRLAHMVTQGGPGAARLAALMAERDPLRGVGADLTLRLRALDTRDGDAGVLARVRQDAKRLKRFEGGAQQSVGAQAALAYPDRIGLRRAGDQPRYVLSGGKGAVLSDGDGLSGARLIVATDLDGNPREARVRLGVEVSENDLRRLYADQIGWHDVCQWSKRHRRVETRQQERFGALVLADRAWKDAPADAMIGAAMDGIRDLGIAALGWSKSARLLRARVAYSGVADVSDEALADALSDWAAPFLSGVRSAADLARFDPAPALEAWLGWDALQEVNRLAPEVWTTPMNRRIAIDYSGDAPEVALRLQEVFGTTKHPLIGPDRLPLKVTLLSPAQRPVQVTTDLPGFWDGSYADVRKDMRARYPRHPWPEDPREADPTLRVKPRGT
ncbi:ATP-dependent helicase HrpB [Rhodobacteraceae bacterium N5(2021)]|uniref:ATP-dependent helicase HrpB n=1 Tax=Gymnodinialimonas phycosphaerae TaxID=2841589 RepID=A0A975YE52_9RHOB|nr:ATP-dependent helicase HrpB [Gymnodinialimonas phycosphaerae]MBY4893256.1 ATP-dependent helicase HrpB [Gymnodinialimonas phycosphaerae]